MFIDLLREQASALKNPPVALDELLKSLARFVPSPVQCAYEALPKN